MRQHFLFLRVCGCPRGLVEKGSDCRDENEAWQIMYLTTARAERARDAGISVELIDHDRYIAEYAGRMSGCIHQGGA